FHAHYLNDCCRLLRTKIDPSFIGRLSCDYRMKVLLARCRRKAGEGNDRRGQVASESGLTPWPPSCMFPPAAPESFGFDTTMTRSAPLAGQALASAVSHADLANAIRALAMDAVEKANSGHPGMPMGMADVATVLFTRFLRFDASAPDWPDRDRFVLSAGHGSMLLYALLHLTGYSGMTMEELANFRQLGSKTAGHP